MRRHTEGPWHDDPRGFIATANGMTIARAHSDGHHNDKTKRRKLPAKQNARLIARAPTMLAALVKLAEAVRQNNAAAVGAAAENAWREAAAAAGEASRDQLAADYATWRPSQAPEEQPTPKRLTSVHRRAARDLEDELEAIVRQSDQART